MGRITIISLLAISLWSCTENSPKVSGRGPASTIEIKKGVKSFKDYLCSEAIAMIGSGYSDPKCVEMVKAHPNYSDLELANLICNSQTLIPKKAQCFERTVTKLNPLPGFQSSASLCRKSPSHLFTTNCYSRLYARTIATLQEREDNSEKPQGDTATSSSTR